MSVRATTCTGLSSSVGSIFACWAHGYRFYPWLRLAAMLGRHFSEMLSSPRDVKQRTLHVEISAHVREPSGGQKLPAVLFCGVANIPSCLPNVNPRSINQSFNYHVWPLVLIMACLLYCMHSFTISGFIIKWFNIRWIMEMTELCVEKHI